MRVAQGRCDNSRRKAELNVIGDSERFLVICDTQHRCHRADDFFLVHPHLGGRLGNKRGRDVISVMRALEAIPAGHELGPLRALDLEVARNGLELIVPCNRSALDLRIESLTEIRRAPCRYKVWQSGYT